ncbi:MAG TPA: TIR domain-containing protein, partial [Thermoanaerobaculia bacterium]|nr:TIR domain-containing protein [Thermoanaerobaculia bacterium]
MKKIFLSYATEDLLDARRVYLGLRARDLEVWFDKEGLEPGRWKDQIEDAIATSRYMVLCLSRVALRKLADSQGFQKNELRLAYDFASTQSGRGFSIIPLRLEECGRAEDHRLSMHQQFDFFIDPERTLDRLALVMGGRALGKLDPLEQKHETEKFLSELLNTAKAATYAKDYDLANAIYSVIIDTDLERPAFLLNNKSNVLSEQGKKEEALAAIDEAIRLQPKFAPFYISRANLRRSLGMIQEALSDCREALEGWEQFENKYGDRVGGVNLILAVIYSTRANLNHDAGDVRAAVSDLNTSIAICPEFSDSFYKRGCLLLSIGEVDKALEDFHLAISLNPGHADTYCQRAKAWLGREQSNPEELSAQYTQAIEDLNKAVAIAPDHFPSHYLLSVLYCSLGDQEAALRHALCVMASGQKEYIMNLATQPIFARL